MAAVVVAVGADAQPDLALQRNPTTRRAWAEARASAAVRHENVVTTYHVADAPDFPWPYLVMEYIQGEPLSALLQERKTLPAREAATIVRQAALGLAAAHAVGLVHRDVKPSNLIVEPDSDRVRVTDFGLARALDGCADRLTHAGGVIGTPAYMSPEQVAAPSRVDPRSDVYSLGAVLYELLTGEPPFRGLPHVVLQRAAHEAPQPVRQLNDEAPRDLETICLKCLEKPPVRRYLTGQALADDLRRWLKGEPIQARPVGRLERGWRWCRRNRAEASLVAAILRWWWSAARGPRGPGKSGRRWHGKWERH